MSTLTPQPPTPTSPEEILTAAAEHIGTYGWHRGDLYSKDAGDPYAAPCCMVGAIRAVTRTLTKCEDCQPKAVKHAQQVLAETCHTYGASWVDDGEGGVDYVETVADWNDGEFCDTESAVVLLLDAAGNAR